MREHKREVKMVCQQQNGETRGVIPVLGNWYYDPGISFCRPVTDLSSRSHLVQGPMYLPLIVLFMVIGLPP